MPNWRRRLVAFGAGFDRAFLSAVIGEVLDKGACPQSVHRVLKLGGPLVFAEQDVVQFARR